MSSSSTTITVKPGPPIGQMVLRRTALLVAALSVLALLVWQGITAGGTPNPETARRDSVPAILDIAVLVFREGLECILVLSAVTAGLNRSGRLLYRPVASGVGTAIGATLVTWMIAVGIISDLTQSFPALSVQAGTGLLAIFVLLVVMNWFFHNVYWTGWISFHAKRKQELMGLERDPKSRKRLWLGMALLGFTSFYREGFEVVLFLQRYRLKLGGKPVLYGVLVGCALTIVVAVLTFLAHRRLPYRRMLVLTGILLGIVLLVMVGEEAQEMQLVGWLPTSEVGWLAKFARPWMGVWFSVYPTLETLAAQLIAGFLVLGCYFSATVRSKIKQSDQRQDRHVAQNPEASLGPSSAQRNIMRG